MKPRLFIFYLILFLSFGTLLSRLFYLNIVKGEENRLLADGQRVRLRPVPAPRGIIFDRNGKMLVNNVPLYKRCDLSSKCDSISRKEALLLETQNKEAQLLVEIGREYPYPEVFAHVLGYVSEVNPEEVEKMGRKMGDLIGRTGIEEQFDEYLRGVDGGELLEVDASGVTLRKIGEKQPVAGSDLHLSLDSEFQKTAYEAFGGKKGALIAQNPVTGEILALVSSPSFNSDRLGEALEDARKPLFNRAISGGYPPGSTFKIVTAAAGLEDGKINRETTIDDQGVISIGTYHYTNWFWTQYGKTEGSVNLVWAIKRSTDTFFYKVGEWVGAKRLIHWSKLFGLGAKTGIDLPGEIDGTLPDPEGRRWFLGNTYHLAIGQGDLNFTPLQVNRMTGVIASWGKLCQPFLVKPDKELCQRVNLREETIALITEGMKEACSSGGTAYPFFDFEPQVACKTGTAEFGDPKGRTHGWFTAFAPADNPEIVITALVEGGGEGSQVAAPIVREVLDFWFHKR